MSYMVFWLEDISLVNEDPVFEPRCRDCDNNMTLAMQFVAKLRSQPHFRHVTISCENPDQVGKMGVQSVEDGKLPDGTDYTWKMRR